LAMINQQNVKNIILDLGGVLVDINPELTFSSFKRIFRPEILETLQWNEIPEEFIAIETGKWAKHQFLEYFQNVCKAEVTEEEIIDSWCAMILDFPHDRVEMVKTLSEKYQVFLLSNTNTFHIKYFEKEFKNRYHFSLHKLFSKVYYSSEIGYRKPDIESYLYVMNDAGIKAEETIMVDDREDNCLIAESLGMKSLKVPEKSGLEAVIDELLMSEE
jgi:HAD superfamily hydrolase (TIGR01509 family)